MEVKHAALILEGGATRGIFTAGVVDYLMEQNFYTDYVSGVSIGSCNGVDYVSRQKGRTKECMIPRPGIESYMGMKTALKKHMIFDMDMIFKEYPERYIPFDWDTYRTSPTACDIVVTNCLTGQAEYRDNRESVSGLMQLCRASCSMPLAAPVVEIDGVPYLDGGCSDSIPIDRAASLGYEKMILVLTQREDYVKTLSKQMALLLRENLKEYPNILHSMLTRPERYNEKMRRIAKLEEEGKIFVIRPLSPVLSRTESNKDARLSFYYHGYRRMMQRYPAMLDYLKG